MANWVWAVSPGNYQLSVELCAAPTHSSQVWVEGSHCSDHHTTCVCGALPLQPRAGCSHGSSTVLWVLRGFGHLEVWGWVLIRMRSHKCTCLGNTEQFCYWSHMFYWGNCFDSVGAEHYNFYIFIPVQMTHLLSLNTVFKHLKCLQRLFPQCLSNLTQLGAVRRHSPGGGTSTRGSSAAWICPLLWAGTGSSASLTDLLLLGTVCSSLPILLCPHGRLHVIISKRAISSFRYN